MSKDHRCTCAIDSVCLFSSIRKKWVSVYTFPLFEFHCSCADFLPLSGYLASNVCSHFRVVSRAYSIQLWKKSYRSYHPKYIIYLNMWLHTYCKHTVPSHCTQQTHLHCWRSHANSHSPHIYSLYMVRIKQKRKAPIFLYKWLNVDECASKRNQKQQQHQQREQKLFLCNYYKIVLFCVSVCFASYSLSITCCCWCYWRMAAVV